MIFNPIHLRFTPLHAHGVPRGVEEIAFVAMLVAAALAWSPVELVAQRGDTGARLVTLGGSVTEIVYGLGLGDRVVATDESSLYPAAVERLPRVGYYRQLPAEGVLSVRPTMVLAAAGTGPPATLAQIRSAGVQVVALPDEPGVEGGRAQIRRIAGHLGRVEAGEAMVRRLEADLAVAERLRAGVTRQPRVLFIFARGAGTAQVAGRETAVAEMIRLAGGVNAVDGFSGTRPLTPEAAVAAAPDVILVSSHGLESVGGVQGVLALPGLTLTPAGRARRVVHMDDLLLLGFGPRTGKAVEELILLLHPEIRGP